MNWKSWIGGAIVALVVVIGILFFVMPTGLQEQEESELVETTMTWPGQPSFIETKNYQGVTIYFPGES